MVKMYTLQILYFQNIFILLYFWRNNNYIRNLSGICSSNMVTLLTINNSHDVFPLKMALAVSIFDRFLFTVTPSISFSRTVFTIRVSERCSIPI